METIRSEEMSHDMESKVKSLTDELLFCYEELDFIYESGNLLSSMAKGEIDGWKTAAGSILDNAIEVLEADFGWIYFTYEGDGQQTKVEETRGLSSEKASELSSLFTPQVTKHVAMGYVPLNEDMANKAGPDLSTVIFVPFKSGEHFFGAIALGRKDGMEFTSQQMKLLSHFSGYSAQFLENARMFQEIKQSYLLSQEANRKLNKLNRMKESLIAVTSHELKTPVSVLFMCIDLMKDADPKGLTESNKNIIGMLKKGTEKLDTIIRNICMVSGMEGGSFSMNSKTFRLFDLVENILDEISFVFKKRRVSIQTEIASSLEIFGDREMISNVISELVMNAIKHTPDGGSIKIIGSEKEGGTVIKIEDNGKGLPEEDKEHIFEKFHRVGEHMNHSSGTYEFNTNGICVGLAMTKSIVDAHKGRIWVESPPGKGKNEQGCRFVFFLPGREKEPCYLSKGHAETVESVESDNKREVGKVV